MYLQDLYIHETDDKKSLKYKITICYCYGLFINGAGLWVNQESYFKCTLWLIVIQIKIQALKQTETVELSELLSTSVLDYA